MANLYTKTGDKGQTSLVGGSRIGKDDLRVECYGTVDEMGSALGFARSINSRPYIQEVLKKVQGRLFSLAAEIASDADGLRKLSHLIDEQDVAYLEAVVDKCTETTGIQTSFVVPGENPPSGALHFARTVVRRCERVLIRLSRESEVRQTLLRYVNRLSDTVYALARLEETLLEQDDLRQRVEEEVRKQLQLRHNIRPFNLENVEKIALRAREKAQELKVPIVFAAVDAGGNAMLLQRMENAFIGSIDLALNKAYTANAFQQPTHILGQSARPGEPLYGIETSNNCRIVLFGGGFPYRYQNCVVGAIGVSGGSVEEDMAIAEYALGDVN